MKRPLAVFVFFLLLSLAFAVIPHADPTAVDLAHSFAGPGKEHLLGSDDLGRDIFSRLVHGYWRTLMVMIIAAGISACVGIIAGVIAGYFGGIVRTIIMAVTDFLMIVPTFIAALIFAALAGLTPASAGVVIGIFGIGPFVNQAASLTSAIMHADYIQVDLLMGRSSAAIVADHLIPAVMPACSASLGSTAASAVLAYAGLSYIGLGVDSTNPDWGTMLYDYRVQLTSHPWLVLWPIFGILILAMGCHFAFDHSKKAAL